MINAEVGMLKAEAVRLKAKAGMTYGRINTRYIQTLTENRKRCGLSERSDKSSKPESAAEGSRLCRAKVTAATEQFAETFVLRKG